MKQFFKFTLKKFLNVSILFLNPNLIFFSFLFLPSFLANQILPYDPSLNNLNVLSKHEMKPLSLFSTNDETGIILKDVFFFYFIIKLRKLTTNLRIFLYNFLKSSINNSIFFFYFLGINHFINHWNQLQQ